MLVVGTLGEEYILPRQKFDTLYEHDNSEVNRSINASVLFELRTDNLVQPSEERQGFAKFRPRGVVFAHTLTQAEIANFFPHQKFVAKWGETMVIHAGDIIAAPHPLLDEVYRIARLVFEKSYQPLLS
jgi:hypothetical protein